MQVQEEEIYGINRENAHPRAIELIPEEFFWDGSDEMSPFGNDEGDMALSDYREWRAKNPAAPILEYMKALIKLVGNMDFERYNEHLLSREKMRTLIISDKKGSLQEKMFTLDTSIIATGFGQLVDEGKIDATIKPAVQTAIQRQKLWADLSIDWMLREEYTERMEVLERVLGES